eukprot:scaffold1391_cov123-Cylindrotheca_fusiformis.AAC.7
MKRSGNDQKIRPRHKRHLDARMKSKYDLALVPHVPARFAHQRLIESLRLSKPMKVIVPQPTIVIMNDVVPSILSYCDGPTLAKAACVCREWNTLCNQDHLWENLCRQKFGVSATELKPAPDPIKDLYILSHKQLRSICTLTHQSLSGIRSIPNVIPMSSFSQVV